MILDHTQRRSTVGRTPLDECSILRTEKHQMPPTGFEPTISAGERPQTYALDRTATGPAVRLIQSSGFQTAVLEEIMQLLFCNN